LFKPVSPRLNVTNMEEAVLHYWTIHHIFEKSDRLRTGGPDFVFFEGPPSANGKPGVHHALSRAFKDIFLRYKLMRGYHVMRRAGWDTHGLPVEISVEKQLGFSNKAQIESFGIAKFNQLCRRSAFDYIQDWERFSDRIGFWVDFEDAYVTYTTEYIESVWWILKTLWDKGLIYQGFKVVPYCPRCGTPLSDHEVAMGYQETQDPSIYLRFPLVDEPGTSLLVWTTTPWTLPGNVAIAANPEVEYVTIERALPDGGSERLVLAKSLLQQLFGGERVKVLDSYRGRRLRGKRYHPLFTFLLPDKAAHYIVMGDYVTTQEGSGLVHIAPAFGAQDMQSALEHDLPVLLTLTDEGTFINEVRPWSGKFVKDADPLIIQDLQARGLLFKADTLIHTYPFCWRCDTPLLYTARGTWFIRTSQHKEEMVALNRQINWVPEHFREGRFGNWLENNVDWALGRERYWGTPLPVWECQKCRHQLMVGSVEELSTLAGRDLSGLDLHRPYVDEVELVCPECSSRHEPHEAGIMKRVPELIDVWFDSGSMPVAQWHYPFENNQRFDLQFPADFICEGVDQTRGWFYSLHAISTLLFDQAAFRNVICLGLILDAEGQKMSKSRGNIIDPWSVLAIHGADAFRWYLYTASPPGQERRFSVDLVGEVVRGFTLTLWNVYAFFVAYANIDDWQPQPAGNSPQAQRAENDLDRWLRSELNLLVRDVTTALDTLDVPAATRPIQAFVERLSNWYLRRSRRRFWKSESGADKQAAYTILYETLVTLSKLLAPSMPFLSEELYQNLVRSADPGAPESVHLTDWPTFDARQIDQDLNDDMHLVMKLASLGRSARNQAGIKVRQPLEEASFFLGGQDEARILARYADLLADELNVKRVRTLEATAEAVTFQLNPLPRQLGQKYQSLFPKIRSAVLELEAEEAAHKLLDGQSLEVAVEGRTYEIQPHEVELRAVPLHGLAVATEGAYLAALKTALTPELRAEGYAREIIRRVQDMRKRAGFDIQDRIRIYFQTGEELGVAFQSWGQIIQQETLATQLRSAQPPKDAFVERYTLDEQELELGIEKV
jgi:isoleucyl-tRNA synthetase